MYHKPEYYLAITRFGLEPVARPISGEEYRGPFPHSPIPGHTVQLKQIEGDTIYHTVYTEYEAGRGHRVHVASTYTLNAGGSLAPVTHRFIDESEFEDVCRADVIARRNGGY